MPTGYTAELYENEKQSFEDFVLSCARAMCACVMQRDDPASDLPKLQKPSDFYAKELEEANVRLRSLKGLTREGAEIKASQERTEKLREREANDYHALQVLKRYQTMLTKVKQWIPPSKDHEGLKDFMVQQLEESMRFDCHTGDYPKIPEVVSGEQWRQAQIEDTLKDIARLTKHHLDEIKRTEHRNNWIAQLYKSLGVPIEES